MSTSKSNPWCIVKDCNKNIIEKKHFFRFPKEHDRWLQWIHACDRLDLEVMGSEYAHRSYRVCHLHFEEKWYNISKSRAYLRPDAVPTIFFGRNNVSIATEEDNVDGVENQEITAEDPKKDKRQAKEKNVYIFENVMLQEKSKRSMSRQRVEEESPRMKTMRQQISRLKAKVKTLHERNRRLQKELKTLKNIESAGKKTKE